MLLQLQTWLNLEQEPSNRQTLISTLMRSKRYSSLVDERSVLSFVTYKFRIKDSSHRNWLSQQAAKVNFVWNYCNEASFKQLKNHSKWLSRFDLQVLTNGASNALGLNSQVIQSICKEYAERRSNARKRKLSWRSQKRNLGWIPCTNQNVVVSGDSFKFSGRTFRFWKSREIDGKIKCGSFTQDSRGRWYINFVCEVEGQETSAVGAVGIDPGLKDVLTLSDGTKFSRENLTSKYAARLAMAQRANKKKLAKAIHAKIANSRRDWAHKVTTIIATQYREIYIGNVSSAKLVKTRMAKSVLDASWHQIKSFLSYKSQWLGTTVKETNESYSTVTCSCCGSRTGPQGLRRLGVRFWVCNSCGAEHDRDINAAVNILKIGLGHQTPIKGIS